MFYENFVAGGLWNNLGVLVSRMYTSADICKDIATFDLLAFGSLS